MTLRRIAAFSEPTFHGKPMPAGLGDRVSSLENSSNSLCSSPLVCSTLCCGSLSFLICSHVRGCVFVLVCHVFDYALFMYFMLNALSG